MWRPLRLIIASILTSCLVLLQTSALPSKPSPTFTPSSNLHPSMPLIPLQRPQIQCYNNGSFPVSGYGCLELTRAMLIARNSGDIETRNTGNTSMEWIYHGGSPCIVKVGAYKQNASESDTFNWRGIAIQAMAVLRACGSGDEKVSWGGKGPVGTNNRFWVEVTSGLNSTTEASRVLRLPGARRPVDEKKLSVTVA